MIRERSERGKIEKKKRFGHKQIIGPRPLGGAPGARPLDPLVRLEQIVTLYLEKCLGVRFLFRVSKYMIACLKLFCPFSTTRLYPASNLIHWPWEFFSQTTMFCVYLFICTMTPHWTYACVIHCWIFQNQKSMYRSSGYYGLCSLI